MGIQLAAKACFKPSGAVGAFEKLAAAEKREGVKIPQLLRTHPLSEVKLRLMFYRQCTYTQCHYHLTLGKHF